MHSCTVPRCPASPAMCHFAKLEGWGRKLDVTHWMCQSLCLSLQLNAMLFVSTVLIKACISRDCTLLTVDPLKWLHTDLGVASRRYIRTDGGNSCSGVPNEQCHSSGSTKQQLWLSCCCQQKVWFLKIAVRHLLLFLFTTVRFTVLAMHM